MAVDSIARALLGDAPAWNGWLTITASVVLPFLLTYVLTCTNAYWILNFRGKRGNWPPPAPYVVPLLGNTLEVAASPQAFIGRMISHFGKTPFRFLVGTQTFYHIPPGEAVLSMFRLSRDLTAKPLVMMAMRDQLGMPARDLAVLQRDDSGINSKPADGFEDMPAGHRILYAMHRDVHSMLSGASLDAMTARFVARYRSQLRATPAVSDSHDTWTTLPSLYPFLRDFMFNAATSSLFGDLFLDLSPSFAVDFWDYDSHTPTYLRRLPRWLAPDAYAVRDRALTAIKTWRQHAAAQFDDTDTDLADAEWEPIWGSRLMRARRDMLSAARLSEDGAASTELGLIWATNANAIPTAMWVLLGVLATGDGGLVSRIRAETDKCFDRDTGEVDVAMLCGGPLLTSVYLEALRYSVVTMPARAPLVDVFTLGEWEMERGSTLMSMSWFGARDEGFWNSGRRHPETGEPEHPVDEFWAERFLAYPGDEASGPIRKADESVYAPVSVDGKGKEGRERTVEEDRTAKVVTTGIQGYFYPYGGGIKICPGRFFAKQEIMVAVAVMLDEFDIELVDMESARQTRPDTNCFPAGALPPDRTVAARVRRRQWTNK
ncbi:cytochrome P450 [Cercophora scortea]|uniref:Cytochrome P450 n=1 Tax=Cercophora scortea TaxID=314031 RepID=A0AAE0I8B7_9PEZI|nr:cytochrome P450 [Cercophora scortea]